MWGWGTLNLTFSVTFCLPLKKLLDTFGNFKSRPNTTHLDKSNHPTNKAQHFLMKPVSDFDLFLLLKPPVVSSPLWGFGVHFISWEGMTPDKEADSSHWLCNVPGPGSSTGTDLLSKVPSQCLLKVGILVCGSFPAASSSGLRKTVFISI